eukprot:14617051-Alexandrium_andersonii.AAC.1
MTTRAWQLECEIRKASKWHAPDSCCRPGGVLFQRVCPNPTRDLGNPSRSILAQPTAPQINVERTASAK